VVVDIEQGDVALAPVVVPYQDLLRSVGAHLDEQITAQICVLETDDKFWSATSLVITHAGYLLSVLV
jgi:hypothetical protein